jgi:hypothetical protein
MLDPSTISTRGAARAAVDDRPAQHTLEATLSDFDRFIRLGREWADRKTFWLHLEGQPSAWLQALEWQLIADAMPRAGGAGQDPVEIPRLDPRSPERRLIEAKRAHIRGVLRASAGRGHAA